MLLVSRSMGYSFLQSINQVLLVQLGGVLHLAGDPSGEARLSKLCCWHQCPAFQGISFRDGTGRDFCKIPGSRDFPGRDLPHIFIPGFFGNCSGFFGIFLFDTIGDQFKHFSRAGKPNKHFFHQKNRPANCRREDLQRF